MKSRATVGKHKNDDLRDRAWALDMTAENTEDAEVLAAFHWMFASIGQLQMEGAYDFLLKWLEKQRKKFHLHAPVGPQLGLVDQHLHEHGQLLGVVSVGPKRAKKRK